MRTPVRARRLAIASLCLIAATLVVPSPSPALAQQLATIQGTITDQTGGVMPGVTITVTNTATGVVRTVTTNERGIFRVQSLDPGTYEVTAEIDGFRKGVRTDVTLSVGATLGLNFTLEPGAVSELVTVTGVSPDIQTERADISAVVEWQKVVDLPLVGRNPLALAALQPGMVGIPGATDFLAPEQGIGVNASGQRGSANDATVDGMSISGTPWGGTVLLVPNVEAVQEFQVVSNNQSAEYGRNSGAAISIITKSGTNELKGSAFEFHRGPSLRSKGIFETRVPDFTRDDFGASLGGPIRRDSTFFFGSYEGVREVTGTGAIYTVETQQFVDFVKSTRPNSLAAKLLQTYKPPSYPTTGLRDLGSPAPGANRIGPADGIPDVGNINFAFRNERTGDQFNGRVDHVFSPNDTLRASYYYSAIDTWYNYLRSDFNHPYPFRNHLFTSSYTRILSGSTLNEMSFGYLRMHGEAGDPTPEAPTIGITAVSAGFGVEFWHPIYFTQNNFEFKDVLTMNRGAHSLRFGGEFRLGMDDSEMHHWERPNYSFTSILDFADDEPFSETRAVDPATGQSTLAEAEYRTKEFSFFIQDNWKVRSNLTLNVGLRYENFGNPTKANGPFNGIVLGSGATRQEQMRDAVVETVDKLYGTDWNNFAPRLGVSWDPKGDAKLVFRAGAGVAHNRINNTVWSDEKFNPPQFAQAATNIFGTVPIVYSLGPNYPPNPALGRGLDSHGGITGARVALRVIDSETVIPYAYNWFVGAQRQLPWNIVVEANYIGSAGRKLMSNDGPGGEDYNRFAGDLYDGRQDRINSSFASVGLAESRIASEYHGMTLQVSRRYSKGFSFQASYTLGKATDMAGNAMEVTQPELDQGRAGHDIRHAVRTNVIWQIPYNPTNAVLKYTLGGWQLNGITVFQSGGVFTVTCGLPYPQCDFNADGQTGDRPNSPTYGSDLGDPTQDEWIAGVMKASDFPYPTGGALGTLPRNSFNGPSYVSTDFSLFKNIELPWTGTRTSTVQVRIEAFNVFNTVNLNNPTSALQSTNFGKVTSSRVPRVVQLGVKFIF